MKECLFCSFVREGVGCHVVYEDEYSLAFLDNRPLLKGHTLVIPKMHCETLLDLPADLVGPLFEDVRKIAGGVVAGMAAEGFFTAINTKVSQSVPHLHVHVIPRWAKDGLFSPKLIWRRKPYDTEEEAVQVREAVARSIRFQGE